MPRHAAKLISSLVKASTPRKIKVKRRTLVRRVTQGALLAVTLAAARLDVEEAAERKRLFSAGLLDRLRAPITRHHE